MNSSRKRLHREPLAFSPRPAVTNLRTSLMFVLRKHRDCGCSLMQSFCGKNHSFSSIFGNSMKMNHPRKRLQRKPFALSPRPAVRNLRAALWVCSQEVLGLRMFPYAKLLRGEDGCGLYSLIGLKKTNQFPQKIGVEIRFQIDLKTNKCSDRIKNKRIRE